MIPIYVLTHTPGATEMVEWTAICHLTEPSVIVHHNARRWTSRHVNQERKHPFDVCWSSGKARDFSRLAHPISSHKTLGAAMRAATSFAKHKAYEAVKQPRQIDVLNRIERMKW